MKMIVVTQCCCGCTVRTGCIIIGVIFAIFSVADFALEVVMASKIQEGEMTGKEQFTSKGETISAAIFSIVVFSACVCLIFGTVKERVKWILVWLIVYVIYCAFLVLYCLQVAIAVCIHPQFVQELWEIPAIMFVLALSAYSVIVVYSHYRNLKDGVTLPPRTPVILTA